MGKASSKLTIDEILAEDTLKQIADKIISKDIDDIILIYRDVKTKEVCWATTIRQWATLFGEMIMADELMHRDWGSVSPKEDEEGSK